LRSVLENLIKNALESAPSGHQGESIEVHVSSSKSKVTISVMDRGEGISPEARERIFDPFYTSKTTGSGIGLAIARRFVEAAEGSLSLSPRSGGGTVAEVSLKRERDEDTGR
jgi:signal transduction histidine kinase